MSAAPSAPSAAAAAAAAAAGAAASGEGEYKPVGKYQLRKVSKDERTIVYRGYDGSKPSEPLRAKAFIRDAVEARVIAGMIKVQEHLGRAAVKLYARYQFLYARQAQQQQQQGQGQQGADAAATAEEDRRTQVEFSDEAVPFLCMCSQHLCYMQDKLHSSSKIYVIREYMPNTLADVVRKGRLPEEGALYYFFQLLQAVYFLHENKVLHRAISAEHVMISADGATLKLAGFGGAVFDQALLSAQQVNNESFFGASFAGGLSVRGGDDEGGGGGGGGGGGVPPPGSYGTCPHCHKEVPIVADLPPPAASAAAAAPPPPVNTLFTSCKHCGIPINRLQVLQSAVGSPAYLAPEVLTPQHTLTSMMNSVQATSMVAMQEQMRREEEENVLFQKYFSHSSSTANLTAGQAKDMWSLGVVLYVLLTSSLPFDAAAADGAAPAYPTTGSRTPEEVYRMCTNIVAVRYTIPPYVSAGAAELVQCLLTRSPRRRPSAQDLMHHPALQAARTTLGCG